MKLTQFSRK